MSVVLGTCRLRLRLCSKLGGCPLFCMQLPNVGCKLHVADSFMVVTSLAEKREHFASVYANPVRTV